jgi:F0F1-type ATP synthase assembly protein I
MSDVPTLLGHILGVPIEELVIPLISGMGAGILAVVASSVAILKRSRRPSPIGKREQQRKEL